MKKKICSCCLKNKKLKKFYAKSKAADSLMSRCKKCCAKRSINYSRSISGLITKIYSNQRNSSKQRNHTAPTYTKVELTVWLHDQDEFFPLYDAWVNSKFNKELIPSIDRLDDDYGYSFGNIQLITWGENRDKGTASTAKINQKVILQYDKQGVFLAEYPSIMQASKVTNTSMPGISKACLGVQNTAGNFIWIFKDTK